MSRRQAPRQYPRAARVNEVVRETLADELERMSDPRLGFVTLTGVEVSPDIRYADVYYSVLGSPEERIDSSNALRSASPRLRAVLGKQVRLEIRAGAPIPRRSCDRARPADRRGHPFDPRRRHRAGRRGTLVTGDLESVDEALSRAAKAIDGADVVALACHVTPDGDALGSVLALHHVLLAAGKHSIASFPSPFRVAPHYRDLPGLELLDASRGVSRSS